MASSGTVSRGRDAGGFRDLTPFALMHLSVPGLSIGTVPLRVPLLLAPQVSGGGVQGGPKMAQGWQQDGSKMAPTWAKTVAKWPKMASNCPKMGPSRPEMDPKMAPH